MTMDAEEILLTDSRRGTRVHGEQGALSFRYGGGCSGQIKFHLPADDVRDTYLLEAAAACIAEYNQRTKECPF